MEQEYSTISTGALAMINFYKVNGDGLSIESFKNIYSKGAQHSRTGGFIGV